MKQKSRRKQQVWTTITKEENNILEKIIIRRRQEGITLRLEGISDLLRAFIREKIDIYKQQNKII